MSRHTVKIKHSQTKLPGFHSGEFSLPMLQVSPYFSIGRGTLTEKVMMAKAHVLGFIVGVPEGVSIAVWDNSNNFLGNFGEQFTPNITDVTSDQLKATIIAGTKAALETDSGLTFADSDYSFLFPVVNNRSFSTPSLAVNTSRQPSTSQDTLVNASIDITSTISLTTGQTGKVSLQYADNTGFSINVVTVQSATNGNTGSLTIGLNLSQVYTAALTGIVPAGKYYRLLTTNTTGTPTYGTPVIQEVLL